MFKLSEYLKIFSVGQIEVEVTLIWIYKRDYLSYTF